MFNSCLSIRTGLELSSKSCHRLGFELQFRANSLRSFWQWCLPRPERDLHTVPASIALRLLRSVPVAFATRTFQMHIDHRGLRPRWSGVKPCEANLGSRFVSGFNCSRIKPTKPATLVRQGCGLGSLHRVLCVRPRTGANTRTMNRSTKVSSVASRATWTSLLRGTDRHVLPSPSQCALPSAARSQKIPVQSGFADATSLRPQAVTSHYIVHWVSRDPVLGRPWICVYPKGTPWVYTEPWAPRGVQKPSITELRQTPGSCQNPVFGVCRECVAHTPTKPGFCTTGPGGRGGCK